MRDKNIYTIVALGLGLMTFLMWALSAPAWVTATLAVMASLTGIESAKSSRMAVSYAGIATAIMLLSIFTWWN